MIEILDLLFRLMICAVLIERALTLLFENRVFLSYFYDLGFEEVITFATSVALCRYGSFDLLAVLFKIQKPTWFGILATGAFVAGFSTFSKKFFRDLMSIKTDAWREFQNRRCQR